MTDNAAPMRNAPANATGYAITFGICKVDSIAGGSDSDQTTLLIDDPPSSSSTTGITVNVQRYMLWRSPVGGIPPVPPQSIGTTFTCSL
jgi:hypothetical protein